VVLDILMTCVSVRAVDVGYPDGIKRSDASNAVSRWDSILHVALNILV
jgi:hypothetical protein